MTNSDEVLKVFIKSCARCGQDHGVSARPFQQRPISDDNITYTHWALCPVTRDPVLIHILDEVPEE